MTMTQADMFHEAMSDPPQAALDDIDQALLRKRETLRARQSGPRSGDFVILLNGDLRRIAYTYRELHTRERDSDGNRIILRDGVCLASRFGNSDGRYYFQPNGVLDQSGSRRENIPKSALVDTGEVRMGTCWFFSHDEPPMSGNGVNTTTPCRVYHLRFCL